MEDLHMSRSVVGKKNLHCMNSRRRYLVAEDLFDDDSWCIVYADFCAVFSDEVAISIMDFIWGPPGCIIMFLPSMADVSSTYEASQSDLTTYDFSMIVYIFRCILYVWCQIESASHEAKLLVALLETSVFSDPLCIPS